MLRAARTALCSLLLICAACSSETRTSEKRREASYPGGRRLEVIKKDSFTHYKGLLTGHEYGMRHEYSYSLALAPDRVTWSGGSAEPKQLIVCVESGASTREQIYLRYLDIELEERAAGALDASAPGPERAMKAVARQARLRDERYFFKLLGDVSWINVEPSELPGGAGCSAHAIPNDGELELGRAVSEP